MSGGGPSLRSLQLPPPEEFLVHHKETWNLSGPCSKPPLAAARSCDQKAVSGCRGGDLRTRWWIPVVKEAIKLKKEIFRAWLAQGTPESTDRYQEARRAVALVVTKTKTRMWGEFGKAMEKDFR